MSVPPANSLDAIPTATLRVDTPPRGFVEITARVRKFVNDIGAANGLLFAFLQHTSASLVIQENAAPEVRTDLTSALDRLAPEGAGWRHDSEGPDDMPSHVKAMLTGVCLHVPVIDCRLALGTWQGIYVAEHRARPHRRQVILQFLGERRVAGTSPSQPR
jgi:secondary thiamine-phosphate synthase enzyme